MVKIIVILNESQKDTTYETSAEFYTFESDFALSSDTDSDQSTSSEETKQQTRQVEPNQTIVEGVKANFHLLPGEYGPYFQNFTEIMLFTWITKHIIFKLDLDFRIILLL